MDTSTDGVTLFAGFLFDVVGEYRTVSVFKELTHRVNQFDESRPTEPAPMQLYNELCDWVEERLGKASIIRAGENIGNRAYEQMVADHSLGEHPTPQQIMTELQRVAAVMIQDPKGRGWEILDPTANSCVMRRTQTFNCMLQEGLLRSLASRTGALSVTVRHDRCTRNGDEFCDYLVSWL